MILKYINKLMYLIIAGVAFFNASNVFAATTGSNTSLENPIKGMDSPNVFIGMIINSVLGVVGSLALAMFIYGGFTWMLSSGNKDSVQKGKDILIWATLGMVVIFSAYAIVNFVLVDILQQK